MSKRGGYPFTDRMAEATPAEAEAYAAGVADMLALFGYMDHCKMYDPLVIEENRKTAHTYVFDLWDGGRHHPYETVYQVIAWIRAEAAELLGEEEGAVFDPRVAKLYRERADRAMPRRSQAAAASVPMDEATQPTGDGASPS